jgi:acyl-ACP thioesterase
MKDPLIYEKNILIRSEQVDMTRRIRMSDLFRLLEEASIAHTEALGCTRDKTLDRGLLWVITRQLVEIDELPAYDESVTIRSWQGEMQHVFFPRFYEIEREGRVLVRGQALWMLMEEESRSMAMPEDYDIFIPGRPDAGDMMLPAVVIPEAAGDPSARASLVTRFSQIDINGHMNNTRYFDMIDDLLKKDCGGSADIAVPKKVLANYISELKLGDAFTLDQYTDAGTLFFEGTGSKLYFRIRYDY